MLSKTQLGTIIGLAVGLWYVALRLQGIQVSLEMYQPFSGVVAVLGGLIWGFDRHCWKWRVLRPWLVEKPDISGTWEVHLVSDYINPDTNQRVPPKTCYMRIYQTYSSISMRLMTDESSSEIVSASLAKSAVDGYRVVGVYMNEPKVLIHSRSPIHYGGICLTIQGKPASSLEGSYWTSRKTQGEMKLAQRRKQLYDDFQSARDAYIK